ncbi:MAG: ester cyclase [Armatimonadetes bacterium]|nr:ester cyclase [Armatimonadota bacterium]
MSLETNKALVRRQFEAAINDKDLSVIDTDMADDFFDHASPPGAPQGPEAVRQWIRYLHAAIPDLHATIEDIVAEGDRVVVRNTWRGTHTGDVFGIPATGKPFALTGFVEWRINGDGRIAERWATLDLWGLRRQLGVTSAG